MSFEIRLREKNPGGKPGKIVGSMGDYATQTLAQTDAQRLADQGAFTRDIQITVEKKTRRKNTAISRSVALDRASQRAQAQPKRLYNSKGKGKPKVGDTVELANGLRGTVSRVRAKDAWVDTAKWSYWIEFRDLKVVGRKTAKKKNSGRRRNPGRYKTIAEIRKANKDAGYHFFDRDTMKFFGSKVEAGPYGGTHFVTSEKHPTNPRSRIYIVRRAEANGRVQTVGSLPHHATKTAARDHAKALAARTTKA